MRNLQFQSHLIGEFDVSGTELLGRNGPEFPEIELSAEVYLDPYKEEAGETKPLPYTVTDIAGEFQIKTGSGSNPICRLHSDINPWLIDERNRGRKTVDLRGTLTPHHVNEMEKHRQDGDLEAEVSCILSLHFQTPPAGANHFGRVEEYVDVEIPRSHWTDNVYPSLGGREVFVIEIPKGNQSIEAAWSKIEDAKDAYQNWDKEGASIACREAADAMDRAVREHYGSDSCAYEHRWQNASDGVEHQASFAGHIQEIKNEANFERPEELQVGQADLECLIIRTQSLLKYAEALLRERKE